MNNSQTTIPSGGERRRRQAASQRDFYRMLAAVSSGARLLALEGVQATIVPVRPWFSVFNSVLYTDLRALLNSQTSTSGPR